MPNEAEPPRPAIDLEQDQSVLLEEIYFQINDLLENQPLLGGKIVSVTEKAIPGVLPSEEDIQFLLKQQGVKKESELTPIKKPLHITNTRSLLLQHSSGEQLELRKVTHGLGKLYKNLDDQLEPYITKYQETSIEVVSTIPLESTGKRQTVFVLSLERSNTKTSTTLGNRFEKPWETSRLDNLLEVIKSIDPQKDYDPNQPTADHWLPILPPNPH